MHLRLEGKRAVVTGASAGIGRTIACELAREGVRLVLTARREASLQDVATDIATFGPRPVVLACDLTAAAAATTIADGAIGALSGIEILVNNAGASRPLSLDASDDEWEEALTLNFIRPRQLASRLVGQMIDARWGRIINITGKSEPDGMNGASCAKAAMHSWAKALSREVGKYGVTVNSVAPGRVISEQIERNYTPEYRSWQSDNEIPIGRYGDPLDVASLVCYLASPLAGYITGTVMPVDGGLRRYAF